MALKLPPLNALRVFATAARMQSFVAAAAELGVSPAAVSQQVKLLEAYFGKRLFTRSNNSVALTDAGRAIYSSAEDALQMISDLAAEVLSGPAPARLVISSIPSVAERWLAPALADYSRISPVFRFDLRVEDDPVDFTRDNIDLRIAYGGSAYPDFNVTPLARDAVLPLCSPGLLGRFPAVAAEGMRALPDSALIHTDWGKNYFSHPTWKSWYAVAGLPAPDANRGYLIGTSGLVLDLARDGIGVALGQSLLARVDIAAGRLVPLSGISIPLGHPYCLVYPAARRRRPGLLALHQWLADRAAERAPAV